MDAKKDTQQPQTIVTFNIHSANDKHEDILDALNNCPLCGTELSFVHNSNFLVKSVTEEAFCPKCQIRTRKETFSMQ